MGGSDTTIANVPAPTPEETGLQQDHLNLLRQWNSQINQLRPILQEESGFTTQIDQTKVSEKTKSEIALREQEIARLESEGLSADQMNYRRPGQSPQDRLNELLVQNRDELARFQQQAEQEGGQLVKTPERLEQERRLGEFQSKQSEILGKQIDAFQKRLEAQTGPEAEAALKKQQQLESQFRDVTGQFLERQQKALAGELPVSEALQRSKQQEFEKFREAQARAGNIIVGNTPEEAVARGTGAQTALSKFKERFGILEEQERRGIISGESPLTQAALGQVGAIGAQQFGLSQLGQPGLSPLMTMQPGFTGAIPQTTGQFPGLLTGISQALQPFQLQRQMQFQANLNPIQGQQSSFGPLVGTLLGAGIGGFSGGGLSGASLGAGIGGGIGTYLPF